MAKTIIDFDMKNDNYIEIINKKINKMKHEILVSPMIFDTHYYLNSIELDDIVIFKNMIFTTENI